MTRFDPSLQLSRLIVLKDGQAAYDQPFHLGVNMIRGENGSGKSTIADFIFFALGGNLSTWRNEAARCDFIYAEVRLNGAPMTLRREISDIGMRPMSIFWGTMDEAQKSGIEGWEAYPYRSSANKDSFSQVFFRALGLPEVIREDLDSRITMHQVLRLLYVDQKTQFDKIFRDDDFDSVVTRDAIGDLLVGAYDADLYRLRLQIRGLDNDLSELATRLNGIGMVLSESDEILTVAMLEERLANTQSEQEELQSQLEDVEKARDDTGSSADFVGKRIEALANRLTDVKQQLASVSTELENLDYELTDSETFLKALHLRAGALRHSEQTQEYLGDAVFQFCPACLTPVDEDLEEACPLCRQPYAEREGSKLLRLRNEIAMQVAESERLQKDRRERRNQLLDQLPELQSQRERTQRELDHLRLGAMSSEQAELATLYRRVGYLEREIEDLTGKMRLARALERLEEEKSKKAALKEHLEEKLEERHLRLRKQKEQAATRISERTVRFLKRDLPREVAFQNAQAVSFDFGQDQVRVDGRANFAASSMVYLKNSFHLALLQASLELDFFRHPRFALFDNIEDKGMEPARSHNFQSLIVEASESSEVDHQIIMTTSMPNPELEREGLIVGPYYTHDRRTLDLG